MCSSDGVNEAGGGPDLLLLLASDQKLVFYLNILTEKSKLEMFPIGRFGKKRGLIDKIPRDIVGIRLITETCSSFSGNLDG